MSDATARRSFTFPDFERLTPDLTASEWLAVFLGPHEPRRSPAGERIERLLDEIERRA